MNLKKALAALTCVCGIASGLMAADAAVTDLSNGAKLGAFSAGSPRVAGYMLDSVAAELTGLPYVYLQERGSSKAAAAGFSFVIDKPAVIYLCIHAVGEPKLPEGWTKTDLKVVWKTDTVKFDDAVYMKEFPVGKVEIPVNDGQNKYGFGIPHAAVIKVK